MDRTQASSAPAQALSSLSRWERFGIWVLGFAMLAQGLNVLNRSVFLERRFTDLGVYLRAAWAARTGHDIYAVTDTNGWHYVYPSFLAVLLTPLAEPPPDSGELPDVPYAVSVVLWYVASVVAVLLAIHLLARTLETNRHHESSGSWAVQRRWWALRVVPLVVCLPPLMGTLVHGQVNLFVLLLLAASLAAAVRGRSLLGGLCLSGAICVKVFPAFLLLYPLWRRDIRFLAGCAVGAVLFLIAIPVLYFGPAKAWQQHKRFAEVVLLPGLGAGNDQTVAKELTEVTSTKNQSLQAVLHKTAYLDRATRPHQVASTLRLLAMAIAGLLTAVTVLAAGWRRRLAREETLFFGCLVLLMLLVCPVTHLHYFVLLVPLAMAIVDRFWIDATPRFPGGQRDARRAWNAIALLLGVNIIARILPHVPGFEVFQDLGVSLYSGLLLWAVAIGVLLRSPAATRGQELEPVTTESLRRAA